jgi:Na+/H+-translocating membrane pyrophosphatase
MQRSLSALWRDTTARGSVVVQLNKGYRTSLVLALLGFICATRWLLHTPEAPSAWIHYCACGFVGIVTAFVYAQLRPYFAAPQPPRAKDDTTHTHAHAHAHTAARTPLHVAHAPLHTPPATALPLRAATSRTPSTSLTMRTRQCVPVSCSACVLRAHRVPGAPLLERLIHRLRTAQRRRSSAHAHAYCTRPHTGADVRWYLSGRTKVRAIAEASTTGHGTNIIVGTAYGMKSTVVPTLTVRSA